MDDTFGNPRRYYYKEIGWISPTLLRYVSVYSEIESFIGLKNVNSIVEIGIGYGGQARVINKLGGVSNYKFYDLKDVQTLALTFLARTCPQFFPECLDIDNVEFATFDLVISNYAISELPIDVQKEYLEKVLNNSAHCYLIMNSGASNKTGRSSGKLPQDAFLKALPGSSIHPEIPLTGPDNYVLLR
jgi:putative sugar O-methyltransferase